MPSATNATGTSRGNFRDTMTLVSKRLAPARRVTCAAATAVADVSAGAAIVTGEAGAVADRAGAAAAGAAIVPISRLASTKVAAVRVRCAVLLMLCPFVGRAEGSHVPTSG
nr:hypothetical protein GCM10025699_19660 [Microbacterium flavescens]